MAGCLSGISSKISWKWKTLLISWWIDRKQFSYLKVWTGRCQHNLVCGYDSSIADYRDINIGFAVQHFVALEAQQILRVPERAHGVEFVVRRIWGELDQSRTGNVLFWWFFNPRMYPRKKLLARVMLWPSMRLIKACSLAFFNKNDFQLLKILLITFQMLLLHRPNIVKRIKLI